MDPTVFVIDDDIAVRDSIVLLFKSEEIAVEAHASAEAFLDVYQADRPGCLILDIRMPGMSGLELQRTLAEKEIRIPVIFITGHGDVPLSVRAIKAGALDFIEKPFEGEQLLNRVREAIAWDLRYRQDDAGQKTETTRRYAESIVETVQEPLLILDDNLAVLSANTCFYDTFQISAKTNGAERLDEIAHQLWNCPGLRPLLEGIIVNQREIHDIEISCDFPRLGHKTLLLSARQLQQQTDQPKHLLVVLGDITERKAATDLLFEQKERAQITLQSIGDAVITTDANGLVESLNPVAEQLTAWTENEARGHPIEEVFKIIDERTLQPVTDLLARCLNQGQPLRLEDYSVLISRDGQEYAIQESAAPIRSRDGELQGAVMVFRDVTESRHVARELAHQAIHDSLTGLVNRREFERRLEHAVAGSKVRATEHALCYIDLDQFKIVNDTAGHAAGDELLRQVTALLLEKIRDRDTLARLGGDEFGLLLDNCPPQKAIEIAQALVTELSVYRFVWERRLFHIGASVGLVSINGEAESAVEMLGKADAACYSAKKRGRNRVYHYQMEGGEPARRHTEMMRAADLSSALEQQRLLLYSQPIVFLPGGEEIVHYELLLRLLDAEGNIVLPETFIPAAERYGLMVSVDRWVIHTAFHVYSEVFAEKPPAEIAINLSGNSLNDESLLEYVRQQFVSSGLPPSRVCFEIAETAAIHNLNQAQRFIYEMKGLGCRFALDDFGSGLSSFTYLKKLPVDYLKIDGSFVREILENPLDHAMVEAIIQIGHTMGIRIIAEWAESDAVITCLREMGVDFAQGYGLSSPGPLSEIAA